MRRPSITRGAPLLRWAGVVALTVAVLACWSWARARAEVRGHLLRVGLDLAALGPTEGAREVHLNGARLLVTSTHTRLGVSDALRALARRCVHGGLDTTAMTALLEEPTSPDDEEPGLLDPVMRWDDGARGFVGCLARAEPTERADGSAVRYVYAARRGDHTALVGVSSDGPLELARMFPAQGDAPGEDLPAVPRPAGMRRVLSVSERGEPYGMVVYRGGSHDPEALRRRYASRLRARGWTITGEPGSTLHARARDARLVVSFTADDAGGAVTALMAREPEGHLGRPPWSAR